MARKLLSISLQLSSYTPYSQRVCWALSRAGWEVTAVERRIGMEENLSKAVLGAKWRIETFRFYPEVSRVFGELSVFWALIKAWLTPCDVLYVYGHGIAPRVGLLAWIPMRPKYIVYDASELHDPFDQPVRLWFEGTLLRRCHLHLNVEYHRAYINLERHKLKCPIVVAPPNLYREWPIPAWRPERRRELVADGPEDSVVLRMHSAWGTRRESARMADELFQALTMLPRRFRLAMSREGTPEADLRIERRLAELGILDRVVRLPRMPFQKMLEYTVCADIGVLLYRNRSLNGFFASPGRVTEYLACGLPLLASNFTGLQNLVLQYDVGECVEGYRPESIADGVVRLESAIRVGRYKKERIRQIFEQGFAFDNWEPMVVDAFENLFTADTDPDSRRPEGLAGRRLASGFAAN